MFKAKTRIVPSGYIEKHHVIPRVEGGINNFDNLVELTAKEHYICHWLLTKIYPENRKIIIAFWLMTIGKQRNPSNNFRPSSRLYEEAKNLYYKKMCMPVLQYDLEGNFIKEWESVKIASKELKADVCAFLNGKQLTAGGFKWKYKYRSTPEPNKNISLLRKVEQVCIDTFKVLKIWDSCAQIKRELGIDLQGYLKIVKGNSHRDIGNHPFYFKYEDESWEVFYQELPRYSKRIKQIDNLTGETIKIWRDSRKVLIDLNLNLADYLRGKIKSKNGLRWELVSTWEEYKKLEEKFEL